MSTIDPMNVEPFLHLDLETASICVVVSCCLLLGLAQRAGARGGIGASALFAIAAALATISLRADIALVTLGAACLVQASFCYRVTHIGAIGLAVAGVCTALAGWLHGSGAQEWAFILSVIALVIRVGPWPAHLAMSRLTTRAMGEHVRQLGMLMPLLFVHLRYLDHLDLAVTWSVPMVQVGACSMLVGGLASLGAPTLGRFFMLSSSVHGAIIFMACGAAGAGHEAAALFAGITACVATGGLGAVVEAVRRRAGERSLLVAGGLSHSMPRLAALFLLFGGAGLGLPATAGFVADDLMLHALWQESPVSTVLVIFANALLIIATWWAATRVFFGKDANRDIDDARFTDRVLASACLIVLLVLGFAPRLVLDPSLALLKANPANGIVGQQGEGTVETQDVLP